LGEQALEREAEGLRVQHLAVADGAEGQVGGGGALDAQAAVDASDGRDGLALLEVQAAHGAAGGLAAVVLAEAGEHGPFRERESARGGRPVKAARPRGVVRSVAYQEPEELQPPLFGESQERLTPVASLVIV